MSKKKKIIILPDFQNPDKTISVGETTTLKAKKKINKIESYYAIDYYDGMPEIISIDWKGKKLIITGQSEGTEAIVAYDKKGTPIVTWAIKVE